MKTVTLLKIITFLGLSSAVSLVQAETRTAKVRSQWHHSKQWSNCKRMAKQGHAFEIENAEGKRMIASCTDRHPKAPFDWKSGAKRYRMVVAQDNGHSASAAPAVPSAPLVQEHSNGNNGK